MAFDPISAVFSVASKVIDRVWPDPTEQAKAALALTELQQSGDLAFLDADVQLMTGQIEINKMEAQHGGMFKGGWRPAVGWICAFAMAYKFIVQPFIIAIVQVVAHFTGAELFPIDMLPIIEWSELSVILIGMLGLGTMRTYEKRTTQKG
jgi:hypothetical protein